MKYTPLFLILLASCNPTPKKYAVEILVNSSDGTHGGRIYAGCDRLNDSTYRHIMWNSPEKRTDTILINIKQISR